VLLEQEPAFLRTSANDNGDHQQQVGAASRMPCSRAGHDALMNRYATDRVWPLYLFFVAALLACAYVLVSQVPDALHGEIRPIVAAVCVLLAIPFLIAGVVFVRRYSRTD
jgi:hypothetical protein